MDTPVSTLADIAKILDAAIETEPPKEAAALLERILRRLPGAEGLSRPLLPEDPASPSLLDLAKLLVAVSTAAYLPECRPTARWLIGLSPSGTEQLRQLDTMAKNAGWWPTMERSFAELLYLDQQYEALLATEDWQDPADVLDVSRGQGLDYDSLYAIAQAKLSHCREQEREGRSRVRRHLQCYAELNREIKSLDQRFQRLQVLVKAQATPAP